jgi:hypothetical protein
MRLLRHQRLHGKRDIVVGAERRGIRRHARLENLRKWNRRIGAQRDQRPRHLEPGGLAGEKVNQRFADRRRERRLTAFNRRPQVFKRAVTREQLRRGHGANPIRALDVVAFVADEG